MNNIQSYLSVFDSINYNTKFTYYSTPITHGPRYVKWYLKDGKDLKDKPTQYSIEHRKNVIEPNTEQAKKNVEKLKSLIDSAIINPALFEAPLLEREYNVFWGNVIEKHVDRIVFDPGWAFSSGCLVEMMVALSNKIPAMDLILTRLEKKDIVEEIETAKAYLEQYGLEAVIHEGLLNIL